MGDQRRTWEKPEVVKYGSAKELTEDIYKSDGPSENIFVNNQLVATVPGGFSF